MTAHRAVLVARSEYFAVMFTGMFKEAQASAAATPSVSIGGTTPSAFRALLHYLYTDKLRFDDDDLMQVQVSALTGKGNPL